MEKNHIMNFARKALLFVLLVIVFDWITGFAMRKAYFMQKNGSSFRTTYAIQKTEAELVVFGSSSALHHYVPGVFEDSLGVSYFNAGRDGQSFFYFEAVLHAMLNRYTPKYIILDIHPKQLFTDQESYDRLSALLPYYRSNPEMQEVIRLKSKYEHYKMFSQIYPYNSLALSIATGLKGTTSAEDLKGYVPLTRVMDNPGERAVITFPKDMPVDQKKLESLDRFISLAQDAGVKIYVIQSPGHWHYPPNQSDEALMKILGKHGLELWDYSDDPAYYEHPELFQDLSHLNHPGAELYSKAVVSRMMKEKR